MIGILARVWSAKPVNVLTIHHFLFAGAGFYLDATKPKYALHYNMRTHIQLELPQVLEFSGLPIVNPGICFSPLKLNGVVGYHAHVYLWP